MIGVTDTFVVLVPTTNASSSSFGRRKKMLEK
jgi:hypothetical protein